MTETANYEVIFPMNWLAAARLFAAKEDKRYYLNGVAISHGGLVATNGHYLGVFIDKRFDALPEIIIPNADADLFLKTVKLHKLAGIVTLRWYVDSAGRPQGTLTAGGATHAFTGEEGEYPYWPDYILRRPYRPEDAIQFNWVHLTRFEKAAAALNAPGEPGRNTLFQPCGRRQAARVTLPNTPEFEGVLMGLRDANVSYDLSLRDGSKQN